MCFFKKKKSNTTQILENKTKLTKNANYVELLIDIANGNETIIEQLKELHEKLQYLNPSMKKEVNALDDKIADKLEDMKIEISSLKEGRLDGFDKIMKNIRTLIAERDFQSK